MTCWTFKDRTGAQVIACSRSKRIKPAKCSACGRPGAELLCDAEIALIPLSRQSDSQTCDAKLCERCATVVGEDLHRCPKHSGNQLSLGFP